MGNIGRKEGEEVVREGYSETTGVGGVKTGGSGRGFAIDEGVTTPDFDGLHGGESTGTHVGNPEGGDGLTGEADFTVLARGVVYYGVSDDGEFGDDWVEDFGPDDSYGGERKYDSEGAAELRNEIEVNQVAGVGG